MGIHKELQHALVALAKRQTQVYSDSADFGVLVSGPEDPFCQRIKELINSPDYAMHGLKQTRTEIRTASSLSISFTFSIPWELIEENMELVRCSVWSIKYWKMHNAKNGLVSLSEESVIKPVSEVWEVFTVVESA